MHCRQCSIGDFVQIPGPPKIHVTWAIQRKAWIQDYEWFEKASKITAKDDEMQVSTLMAAIEAEWFEIYNNFKPNEKVTVFSNQSKVCETFVYQNPTPHLKQLY